MDSDFCNCLLTVFLKKKRRTEKLLRLWNESYYKAPYTMTVLAGRIYSFECH